MLAYLPAALTISLGWFLYDPVTLFSSAIFSIWVLIASLSKKEIKWVFGREQFLLFALLATYSLSSIFNSGSLWLTFQGNYQRNFGLLFWISIYLVFAISTSGKIEIETFIFRSLLSVLCISIVYGLIQMAKLDPIPWSNPYNAVQITLGNPNFAGALLGMISVIPIGVAINGPNSIARRFLGTLIFCICLFVAYGTKSLQAFVVAVISVLVFSIILSYQNNNLVYKLFRVSSALLATFVLIFTSALLFGPKGWLGNLREIFFYQGSVIQRLDFWRTGLEIFKSHPIVGVGPDNFQRYAALYRTKEQIERDGIFSIPDKAHSVPIDALANGGIFAGILWIVFVLLIFRRLARAAKGQISPKNRANLAILGGIWSGYVVQALISPDQIVLAVIGFMSAGLIVRLDGINQKSQVEKAFDVKIKIDPIIIRPALSLILLVSLVVWSQAMRADVAANRILDNEKLDKEQILSAINIWPALKTTELIAVAASGVDSNCEVLDDLAERMIEIDVRSAQGWYLEAICRNVKKEFSEAFSASERTLDLDPLNPVYLVANAKLALASGKKEEAITSIKTLKSNFPENAELGALESFISSQP